MPIYANWNGKIVEEASVNLSPNNRSFRYGDGCFETMKLINGQLPLLPLHMERLLSSLITLQFAIPFFFTSDYLAQEISKLVSKNRHESLARVRLVVYRYTNPADLSTNHHPDFIIQSSNSDPNTNIFNEKGLSVDFYNDAVKANDRFSAVKSNNYLPYVMGSIWAKKMDLDDCILSGSAGYIADATIANVFVVSDNIIKTPSLNSGCVAGVMRKFLLNAFDKNSIPYLEVNISKEELFSASEVFLTNANFGIRWVQKIDKTVYSNQVSSSLYKKFITPLFTDSTF